MRTCVGVMASWMGRVSLVVVAGTLMCPAARAQTVLLDETHTVTTPDFGPPVEHDIPITTAGTYKVTLTDLGKGFNPSAPVKSVKLAITKGATLVSGTQLTGEGTIQFDAAANTTYTLRVVGVADTGLGSGAVGEQVLLPNGTLYRSFVDSLLPPSAPNGRRVLDDNFTVATAGNYTVTISDLGSPGKLQVLTAILVGPTGTKVATLGGPTNPPPGSPPSPTQVTTSLTAGQYRLVAVGLADPAAAGAGLFSVAVTPQDTTVAPVYTTRTLPVGAMTQLGTTALSAGDYKLNLTDLKYPKDALASAGAVIVLNGQAAAPAVAKDGSQPFTVVASGTYQIFSSATPGTSGAGSYAVEVRPASGGTAVFSAAQAVIAPTSATTGYVFNATLGSAGTYRARLADFGFPSQFGAIGLAAVQGAAILGTPLTIAGNLDINASAGPVFLLVFAQAASAGGLFGVDLTPTSGGAASGNPVLQTTQAVGTLSTARTVSVTTAGNYDVSAIDVGFPVKFTSLAIVVTQGTNRIGALFAGAQSNKISFAASPGSYTVNVLTQPADTDKAGTYGLTVAPTPPAPAVTFTSDVQHVTSGGTVKLTWSAQNATSCTASGSWSGTQPLSGSVTSAALTADTTFKLDCTGAGGTTSQSVNVTIDKASSGGGGGGSVGWDTLLSLLPLLAARLWMRSRGYRLEIAPVA